MPGTNDDFRTQQLVTTARFNDRWLATLDISIFTNNNSLAAPPERIDTMSMSLGYDFVQNISATERTIVTAGVGVRGVGDFEGARIQNGFHRLIRDATRSGLFDGWNLGYWVRGGALVTTDGQVDAVAGLYAVASRSHYDIWLGLRHDWRSGYDKDAVLLEAARQEQNVAVAWGIRFGSIVLESVHRLDSLASYGQLGFISTTVDRGVLVAGLGIEIFATALGNRWQHSLRFGATGWKPSSSATVIVGGTPFTIHQAGAAIVAAWTIDYH